MPKVHEEEGCRFYIYLADYDPPHVHVFVGDGIVVLALDADVTLIRVQGSPKTNDIQKARRILDANRVKLVQAWGDMRNLS